MYKPILIATITALTLAACASTENAEPRIKGAAQFADDPRLGERVDKICNTRSVNGFSEETRDTVVVSVGASKEYLIETYGGCQNLRDAGSIALDASGSCLRRSDNLIVSQSTFRMNDNIGPGPDRCAIKAIYKWDKDAQPQEAEPEAE